MKVFGEWENTIRKNGYRNGRELRSEAPGASGLAISSIMYLHTRTALFRATTFLEEMICQLKHAQNRK